MSGSARLALAASHEQDITTEIGERRGYIIQPFGQALLSDEVRKRLRDQRCPAHLSLMRWLPDLAVMLDENPRLIAIDAKTNEKANRMTKNHAVELRSILGARITRMPVFYVCCDMRMLSVEVLYQRVREDMGDADIWPCCTKCASIFRGGANELQVADELPEHCPDHMERKKHGRAGGSGTPFIRFPRSWCNSLDVEFPRRQQGAA